MGARHTAKHLILYIFKEVKEEEVKKEGFFGMVFHSSLRSRVAAPPLAFIYYETSQQLGGSKKKKTSEKDAKEEEEKLKEEEAKEEREEKMVEVFGLNEWGFSRFKSARFQKSHPAHQMTNELRSGESWAWLPHPEYTPLLFFSFTIR